MSPVIRKLIAKEVYVNRWFIAGGATAALASVAMGALGKTGFNIGALTWLTTIIATGVMLALSGVINERKEQSLLFVLSLPLSIADYVRAKLFGLTACFLIVWLVASCAALCMVFTVRSVPDGVAPYVVLLCGFMLANFAVLLCGVLHTASEGGATAIIIVTNMGVSIFMFTIGPLPGIAEHMWGSVPVWNRVFWTVLGVEAAVLLIAFVLPFFLTARRRDFI